MTRMRSGLSWIPTIESQFNLGGGETQMKLFTDERTNSFLAIAGMFPMTTNIIDGSLYDRPALGMVVDWDTTGRFSFEVHSL
jgi:hypothetical protein